MGDNDVMMRERLTRTATVHAVTSTAADEYGNPVAVETDTVVAAHYRQLSADEAGPEVRRAAFRLHLPADTSIGPEDRVTLDDLGVTVEVVGLVTEVYNPLTGIVIGKTVTAEVTT